MPRLVAISAVLLALLGVAAVVLGRPTNPWLMGAGVILLIVPPLIWLGVALARWAGIAAALLALLPAVYGIFGMTVVVPEFISCQDGQIASIAATSYPSDYCNRVNWLTQFGTGFALIGVGVAGLVTLYALLTNADHFDRRIPST